MPFKGMRSFPFHGYPPPQSSSTPSTPSPSENLTSARVSEIISKAEAMVTKWNPGGSAFAKVTSLFYESRDEARVFLCAVVELNRAMHYLMTATVASSPRNSARHDLVRAHRLMETAMKRLQKEFFQILSANRDRLDSNSLASTPAALSDFDDDDTNTNTIALSEEDEIKLVGETLRNNVERLPSPAMANLKSIAECMVATGYGKECVKIYKIIRKSIVDEGIYRLRFERLSQSQIRKLDWESVEQRIMNWLTAARFVFKTLFSEERVLCDYIFGSSPLHIKESCFAEITREAAVQFLEFPELVAAATATKTTKKRSKCKSKAKSDEKMHHLLDLHNAITDLWPVIEAVFSYKATTCTVQSQAISSLQKLCESVRATLAEFEMSIRKDSTKSSKSPVVPGGGLHPLTRRVMDNLLLLADYSPALDDIFIDHPLPPTTPNVDYPSSSSSSSSSISARFAWLALVLLCKLDCKADLYKDVALSYLFLANNLHYIVSKVINTPNLFQLLGEAWARKHEEKARGFAKSYQRQGWAKVEAAVEEGKVGEFNRVFKETCRVQSEWVLVDERMREEVVQLVRSKVVLPYKELYERRRVSSGGGGDEVVRYAPEDIERHLTYLFRGVSGTSVSVSVSDSSVGSGSSSLSSFWRTG